MDISQFGHTSVGYDGAVEKNIVNPSPKKRRKLKILGFTGIGIIVVGLGIGLGLGLGRRCSDGCSSVTTPQSTSSSTSSATSTPTMTAPYWKPTSGTTWQYELSVSPPSMTDDVAVYDIDLFDSSAATISSLHAAGKKVICYFSAGSYENWRPDASSFLPADKGAPVEGWPGENWTDTSSENVRKIMLARLDMAVTKDCDGVDPDNVDGYANTNGLSLTTATAIDYLTFLATAAHSRGLAIGLKNAGAIVNQTVVFLDWEVNEQCVEYTECQTYQPFIAAGKPVFHVEYPDDAPATTAVEQTAICEAAGSSGFSTIIKNMILDDWVLNC